jgi:hypothetical protein
MLNIETLETPVEVAIPGGQMTLTHRATRMEADPRGIPVVVDQDRGGRATRVPIVVTRMLGYMHEGQFVDFGDHEVQTLDQEGTDQLLADTTGGKPAGDFRLSDVLPAIERRNAVLEAARQAREAEEAARREQEAQALQASARRPQAPMEG